MKIVYVDSFKLRNIFADTGKVDFNIIHGKGLSFDVGWYIPPTEIWAEKRMKREIGSLIKSEKLEKKLDKKIKDYPKVRRRMEKILCRDTKEDFVKKIFKSGEFTVKLVRGDIERKKFDPGFVAGGHGLVYPS